MVGTLPPRIIGGREVPPNLLPNLLGIGAAKAGTTWLAGILSRHPDIFVPPQKELNCLHYNDFDERIGEYMDYFRGGEAFPVRCDFSVRYLASQNALRAAARVVPDARILVVLRDPVEQVQSHYWHLLRQNFNQPRPPRPVPDLFEALDRFRDLLLEPALYGKHLSRWQAALPAEQFFVVDYAEITTKLPVVLPRLCEFLQISNDVNSLAALDAPAQSGRRGVAPRGGIRGRLYPLLYSVVTRGPYQWMKRQLGVRRVEDLKRRLRLRESAEAVFFAPGYPKLAATGQQRLYEIFQHDIDIVESLNVVDVSRWRRL